MIPHEHEEAGEPQSAIGSGALRHGKTGMFGNPPLVVRSLFDYVVSGDLDMITASNIPKLGRLGTTFTPLVNHLTAWSSLISRNSTANRMPGEEILSAAY